MGKHEQHDNKDSQWLGDKLLTEGRTGDAHSGKHRRDNATDDDPE